MIPRLHGRRPTSLYVDFIVELEARGFEGDCSSEFGGRLALATDNSIYQRVPQGIICPRTNDDVVRIATLAAEPRFAAVKLTPRGGGTGTNGQSLTDGLSIDLSRHMNAILEIDPIRRRARVQAGVVKDQLNAALKPYGLFFAPELSSSNRATIGGMVNTDASGQGSCLYGKTRDHVLGLTTVFLGGELWRSSPVTELKLAQYKQRPGRIGDVHRVVDRIHRENLDLIERQFPKLNRCMTGYDLAHVRNGQGLFDLNSIICGSEGTLGIVVEAELNLLPIPNYSAIVNVRYATFDAALRDAPSLLALKAASIETVDSLVLSLGRGDIVWRDVSEFFPDDPEGQAQGINLVEFVAEDQSGLESQLSGVMEILTRDPISHSLRGYTVARGEQAVKSIWNMRKRAAGLLGNMEGDKRPVPFVEDTAVPPERLADYIVEFRALLDRRGLTYGMFGHVDAGVLHVRPALDLKDPEQERLVREISDEVAALTLKYGGLLWGEHGKGVRSEYGPMFFGPLYPALQRIKAAFDGQNQLNPGKIASPSDEGLLKIDAVTTRGQSDREISPSTQAEFEQALHCNGNGVCFNYDPDDVMCPSWKATGDRRHSPKGRAALMREWLRMLSVRDANPSKERDRGATAEWAALPGKTWNSIGKFLGVPDFSHEVKAAMDGCLSCKSCVGQCPVKVDVPAFRAKFLELYHGRYLRPVRDRLLGSLEHALPLLLKFPRLYNRCISSQLGGLVLNRLGLVGSPTLTGINLGQELAARGVGLATPQALAELRDKERAHSVVFIQDAFTSYFETPLILDAIDLAQRLGFKPWVAPFRPNGKPLHVHGFLRQFRRVAEANAAMLRDLSGAGVDLVGLDPSMTLTYRAEYRQTLDHGAVPEVLLLQEWLARRRPGIAQTKSRAHYFLLPHCTERTNAPVATNDWERVFRSLGAELTILRGGCCGMAGVYGHAAENRQTSERIYAQGWQRQVAAHKGKLLTTGYSCRCQVNRMDGISLPHPLHILLDICTQTFD